jgi:hypothetical protein
MLSMRKALFYHFGKFVINFLQTFYVSMNEIQLANMPAIDRERPSKSLLSCCHNF